jgi:hypothetical protein
VQGVFNEVLWRQLKRDAPWGMTAFLPEHPVKPVRRMRQAMTSGTKNSAFRPRWFVRGDTDGFFGLALDNLIQVLPISSLWTHVLGFSSAGLYDRVLPGIAIFLVSGNLFYAWQAYQLAKRSGRTNVCALPYGIHTVSLIGYVFLIMLPAKLVAMNRGATLDEAEQVALGAGVVAAMGAGSSKRAVPSQWQESGAGRPARPCCPR